MIQIKRVYESPQAGNGLRFLVDRLWPRGISKEGLKMQAWLKEAAPSPDLRRWYGHDNCDSDNLFKTLWRYNLDVVIYIIR